MVTCFHAADVSDEARPWCKLDFMGVEMTSNYCMNSPYLAFSVALSAHFTGKHTTWKSERDSESLTEVEIRRKLSFLFKRGKPALSFDQPLSKNSNRFSRFCSALAFFTLDHRWEKMVTVRQS